MDNIAYDEAFKVWNFTGTLEANKERVEQAAGTYIRCLEASAEFAVKFMGSGRVWTPQLPMFKGTALRLPPGVERIAILSATAQDVRLVGITGDYVDDRFIFSGNVTSTPALLTAAPDALTPVTTGLVVLTATSPKVATNGTTIRQRTIRRDTAGTGVVYLSPTTLTVGQMTAWALAPGDMLIVNHSGDLYCRNDTGGSATICVMNETAT